MSGNVSQQFVSLDDDGKEVALDVKEELASALHDYACENAPGLRLDGNLKIQVRGFHPVFRVAPNGRLLIELVVQYAQCGQESKDDLGGIPFRGGCTLVASSNGKFRYLISKPMCEAASDPSVEQGREARRRRQKDYLRMCDTQSGLTPYFTKSERDKRMAVLADFAKLDGG